MDGGEGEDGDGGEQLSSPTPSETAPNDAGSSQCEMCANYEVSLQSMQAEQDTLREQLAAAKELYEKYGKELSEERLYRKELEGRFAALNDASEQKIQLCMDNVAGFEERLALIGKKQEADIVDMAKELDTAKERQSELQGDLKALYEKYQRLLHKNAQKADEMREQCIDLPQSVDELTLLALQLREDLINEKASREHECQELRDELTVAREQMLEMEMRVKDSEEQMMQMYAAAQQQQQIAEQQQHQRAEQQMKGRGARRQQHQHNQKQQSQPTSSRNTASQQQHQALHEHPAMDVPQAPPAECCQNAQCQRLVLELERRLGRSLDERARLQDLLVEQRNKCSQMQSELDTSEAVQKDFVRLSQDLQVELEKIRQSESEVRWQEADDFGQCNGCNRELAPGPENRINCRHCGKIFCANCTPNKVLSGPSKRSVPVCSLCHTLLSNKDHSLVDRLHHHNINNSQQHSSSS